MSPVQDNALDLIARPGQITLGIELPLDNDGSPAGDARRQQEGRPYGVPDLSHYFERIRQIDEARFAARWLRDVPVFDPRHFGDAGSVYDPFVNLGYLAGAMKNVVLGTAAVVLPLRHPMMVAKAADFRSLRSAAGQGRGAFISALHLDLADDPDEGVTPRRFGARLRRHAFLDHMARLQDVGGDHLAVLLRPSRRPVPEVIDELATDVLPHLNSAGAQKTGAA